jgi:CRP-like cAMP-binding protein
MGRENHFLTSLNATDLKTVQAMISPVQLVRSEVINNPGELIGHIYFPVDSILSVVTVMQDGAQVESRTIGRESAYGLLQVLGSPISFERMLVQVGGGAWRAPLPQLREAALASRTLIQAIVHHAQATIIQASQTVACNSLHPAEQRLCRWLLLTRDRLGSDVLPLTQEHLAIMLGVQRTTVTALASQLQARGAISYVRGRITLVDVDAIRRCACECYMAVEEGVAAILCDAP